MSCPLCQRPLFIFERDICTNCAREAHERLGELLWLGSIALPAGWGRQLAPVVKRKDEAGE